jgi:hypothetical protein
LVTREAKQIPPEDEMAVANPLPGPRKPHAPATRIQ